MKRRHHRRRRLLLLGLVLAALGLLLRGVQVQVVQGADWEARAEEQHQQRLTVPAPRGGIYDRNGVPLASNREVFRVAVAPRELKDPDAVAQRLRRVLGLSARKARRAVDRDRRWVVLPGRYAPDVQQRLEGVPGIHFERVLERLYPHGELARELVGRVSAMGRAQGGIELEADSLLRGREGVAVVRRNARGRPIPGAMLTVVEPEAGQDVYLTIDYRLQEIAHEALRAAVAENDADGGDLLLADPRTGEILAAASRRKGEVRHWWAAMEPYEPGSTLKPFTVAALLSEGRALLSDSVYAENGRYVHEGRTIRDVHGYDWLTLRGALRQSSNIAMAKMAARLERGEQYRYLRDFGFGTPTGIAYPAESSGLLRRPQAWSGYSQASLAIGYEVAVTPLQVAMAYGALANDGVLMAPRIVDRIRSRSGRVVRRPPQRLRRVVPRPVARAVNGTLVEAVESGTGTLAALGGFRVAGKTGTARRSGEGGYGGHGYTASFAGFFPASDPQLVFVVKLDRPEGAYYGGLAAAPVTRRLLEAALAARAMPMDRGSIATVLRPPPGAPVRGGSSGELQASVVPSLSPPGGREPRRGPEASGPYIFALDAGPPRRFDGPDAPDRRPVPDVRGRELRDAVERLHAEGFQVSIEGSGQVSATAPGAGESVPRGALVRVVGRRNAPSAGEGRR